MVAHPDPELQALIERFVCVRLIQMGGVDLAVFQFDPFLSWSLFFMNGDKTIYGRFGRAHPNSKMGKKDSNPNHTLDGMKAALRKALEIHKGYAKKPEEWRLALAGKTGPEPRWSFAEKTPAALKYKRMKRIEPGESERGCVHCHEVHRTAIDSMFMKGLRLPDRMLWLYPRPHVLGLTMDNRHSARVAQVAAGSAAARAGVQSGDDLTTMSGQPLLSIADLQWVLHNLSDDGGALPVAIRRGAETLRLEIELEKGWRRTEDFVWRYRMAGYSSWLWAGVSLGEHPQGVLVKGPAPGWFKKPNAEPKRKLKRGDVIVEVDGKTGLARSDFLAYLMRDKELGSTVRLEVLRKGERVEVTFRLPSKQPEVQGH